MSPPFLEIRRSPIHRRGIFAKKAILKNSRVIEYVGERVSKAEASRRAEEQIKRGRRSGAGLVDLFELNQRHDIDGNVPWNPARLINHCCTPNCEPRIVRGHIWIFALREIQAGEEISYNYGYDWEHYREHPCRCGSPRCVGYIVAQKQWPQLRRALARAATSQNSKAGK